MPQLFWNAGCQLVALNYQTIGKAPAGFSEQQFSLSTIEAIKIEEKCNVM